MAELDDRTLALAALQQAGIRPSRQEIDQLVASYPGIRAAAAALYEVRGVRYEDPAITFDPRPAGWGEQSAGSDTIRPSTSGTAVLSHPPSMADPLSEPVKYRTVCETVHALRAGQVTSLELVEQAIAVADRLDEQLGTFISRYVDQARGAARAADAALAAGTAGPLAGVPLGIKDILTTVEGPTTAQSSVHDPAWAWGDAVAVARLRAAGGIVMGKTSTMEFACGLPDPSKPFPIPRNPWDPGTWAGGSSSGTGNGIVAGMFLGGLGTDTAGSIRIPSAFCGISGLMPTFGRVPKSGCVPLAHTLDHVGPMASSARDCALMLGVLAGYHPDDVTACEVPVPDYLAGLTGDLTGVRVGIDRLNRFVDAEDPAVPPAFDAAVRTLARHGAEIVEVELPLYLETGMALMCISAAEMLAFHMPDARTRLDDFARSNRAGLAKHTFYSAADYVQAQRVRRVAHRAITTLYDGVDLVVTPTASIGAVSFAELDDDLGWFRPIHTAYWDALGNPALSVPMGFTATGLPLGLQIAGRPFEEGLVLRAGDAYQQSTDWHLRRPPIGRQGRTSG